jgi:carbonic anhydrase
MPEILPIVPPDEALAALVAGNARFLSHQMTSFDEDLKLIDGEITERHRPFAAILSCADARVPPEIVFDQPMGALFVTRVAGNITTPEIIASLEYAVADRGVGLIMVLGHGRCGAVDAANARKTVPGQISALYAALRPAVNLGGNSSADKKAELNARIQAGLLRDSSPVLASHLQANPPTLRVVAAYYNLAIPQPPEGPKNGFVTILPDPPAAS